MPANAWMSLILPPVPIWLTKASMSSARTPCKFGAACYRKNPDHRRQPLGLGEVEDFDALIRKPNNRSFHFPHFPPTGFATSIMWLRPRSQKLLKSDLICDSRILIILLSKVQHLPGPGTAILAMLIIRTRQHLTQKQNRPQTRNHVPEL